MKTLKIILAFIFGVLIVCCGFWVSGFDFDKRGEKLFWCWAISLYAGAVFAFITWKLMREKS